MTNIEFQAQQLQLHLNSCLIENHIEVKENGEIALGKSHIKFGMEPDGQFAYNGLIFIKFLDKYEEAQTLIGFAIDTMKSWRWSGNEAINFELIWDTDYELQEDEVEGGSEAEFYQLMEEFGFKDISDEWNIRFKKTIPSEYKSNPLAAYE